MDEEENCDEWICALNAAMGKPCEEKNEESPEAGDKKGKEEKVI